MNIETVIYLSELVPKISFIFTVGIPIFGLIFLAVFLYSVTLEEDGVRSCMFNWANKNYGKLILIYTIAAIIPSEKSMYLMMGANLAKNRDIPSKVEMAIEKKIDGYLNEDENKK